MDQLIWNDSLCVGVRQFDEDHKELARLINVLGDSIDESADSDTVTGVLTALLNYAEGHFGREEECLEKNGFPGFNQQHTEHLEFCEVVTSTCCDATFGTANLHKLLEYLILWWSNHILKSDMSYKEFLNARGVY